MTHQPIPISCHTNQEGGALMYSCVSPVLYISECSQPIEANIEEVSVSVGEEKEADTERKTKETDSPLSSC